MAEAGTVTVPVVPETSGFLSTLQNAINPALAKLNPQIPGLERSIAPAIGLMKTEFASAGTALTSSLTAAGVAGGAIFGALALKGVSTFQDIAGEVRLLEGTLGTTAEQASILRAQAEAVGVSVSSLSTGFAAFSKHVAANDAVLDQYGVTIARTADGQVDFGATLTNLSAVFNAMPPGLERTAAAMNLFGRSGRSLLPLLTASSAQLQQFGDDAEAMGLVMSETDVQAAKELAVAQRELGEALQGVEVTLGRALVPVLQDFADILRIVLTATRPFLPALSKMFTLFLGFKAISFIPTLFSSFAAKIGQLGAAATAGATQMKLFSDAELAAGTAGAAAAAKVGVLARALSIGKDVLAGVGAKFNPFGAIPDTKQFITPDTHGVTTAIKNLAGLTAETEHSAAGWAEVTKELEAATGVQNLNTAAVRMAVQQQIPYAEALHNVAEGLRTAAAAQATFDQLDTAKAVEGTRDVLKNFGADIGSLAELTGTTSRDVSTDITDMVRGVKDALHAGDTAAAAKAWSSGVREQLASAREAMVEMAAGFKESLSFVSSAFSTFVSDTDLSLTQFQGKLRDALDDQKAFSSGIEELVDMGPRFAALAQQFIEAGPESLSRLNQLLRPANKEILEGMARVQARSDRLATQVSKNLTQKLGGTLKEIKGFFEDLLHALEQKLHIDIDGSTITKTKGFVDDLKGALTGLVKASPFSPTVTLHDEVTGALNGLMDKLRVFDATIVTAVARVITSPVQGPPTQPQQGPPSNPTPGGPHPPDVTTSLQGAQVSGTLSFTDSTRGMVALQGALDFQDWMVAAG